MSVLYLFDPSSPSSDYFFHALSFAQSYSYNLIILWIKQPQYIKVNNNNNNNSNNNNKNDNDFDCEYESLDESSLNVKIEILDLCSKASKFGITTKFEIIETIESLISIDVLNYINKINNDNNQINKIKTIVMGYRKHHQMDRIGNNTDYLIKHSHNHHIPLLVLHPETQSIQSLHLNVTKLPSYSNIILCYDGSECSKYALSLFISFCNHLDNSAKILLVYVVNQLSNDKTKQKEDYDIITEGEKLLQISIPQVVHSRILEGKSTSHYHESISHLAQEIKCDLIVAGTHGRTGYIIYNNIYIYNIYINIYTKIFAF